LEPLDGALIHFPHQAAGVKRSLASRFHNFPL
jgi:hypothetical protein